MSVREVRASLLERRELALIDVREEGVFALSHPLFAASLPLSRLELEVFDRIPRRSTPMVVYDAGEGLAQPALERLTKLGYTNVALLDGGLQGWEQAGAELFRDVNVPSKAFGELVESTRHTPSIAAEDLAKRLKAGETLAVLDARRFDEYHTMSIPSATSVPGGELVRRVADLVPDPKTLIVVNCAGRTRSIIGAQSLINAKVPNPVVALRNGTIGWTLAGLGLDRAQRRRHALSGVARREALEAARSLAERAGAARIDWPTLASWAGDPSRTLYRFDVRTPEEFAAGHVTGFRSAPGGQLVQETDVFAPVRGARVVLTDDDGVRAHMAASWLAQMGWQVFVAPPAPEGSAREAGPSRRSLPALPAAATLDAAELAALRETTPVSIVDLSSSAEYAQAHIPGAWFALRSDLKNAVAQLPQCEIVLVSSEATLAFFAAPEIKALTGRAPRVLAGGMSAWRSADLPVESGLTHCLSPIIDRYKRPYEGTDNPHEAMQGYLDWEYGLVAQLRRDGTHHFRVM